MSTLQISLAIIGIVLLTLIVAYNAWTARRNAPKKARPPDLARDSEQSLRHEPGFDADGPHSVAPPPDSIHSAFGADTGPISQQHLDGADPLSLPTLLTLHRTFRICCTRSRGRAS